MASQGNQPKNVDLNFAYSQRFVPKISLKERFRAPDLTQEGHLRGRFKPNQRIPVTPSYTAKIVQVTPSSTLGQILGLGGDVPRDVTLKISFSDNFIANSMCSNVQISGIQKSLRPQTAAIISDVLKSKEWEKGIESIGKIARLAIGSLLAAIIDLGTKDADFFNMIKSAMKLDETLTRLDEEVTFEKVRDLPYSIVSYILSKDGLAVSPEIKQRLNDWYLYKENEFVFEDFLLELPTFSPLFEKIRRQKEIGTYEKPDFLNFDEWRMCKAAGCKVSWVEIDVPEENKDFAYEAGLWIYFFDQSAETDTNATLAFASTRTTVMKYGLFQDSDELVVCQDVPSHDIQLSAIDKLDLHFELPDTWITGIVVSAISYLKSGHHATATGLTNQMTRILNALGLNNSTLDPSLLIRASVYHGSHVASMRLVVSFLREMAKKEALSGAIGYRLYPVPPMFAAYCNLEIFIEALNSANFFKFMDREHEYKKFKSAMVEIRNDMYYCAPYSAYLYGEVRKDPQAAKSLAAELASYASAIASVMPNSTLIASPSLNKLAEQNAQNSISAKLAVDAYVSGYRRFYRSMMTAALQTKMLGAKSPNIGLLE